MIDFSPETLRPLLFFILLLGPTIAWILYRLAHVQPQRLPPSLREVADDGEWFCPTCRSLNHARASRCYRGCAPSTPARIPAAAAAAPGSMVAVGPGRQPTPAPAALMIAPLASVTGTPPASPSVPAARPKPVAAGVATPGAPPEAALRPERAARLAAPTAAPAAVPTAPAAPAAPTVVRSSRRARATTSAPHPATARTSTLVPVMDATPATPASAATPQDLEGTARPKRRQFAPTPTPRPEVSQARPSAIAAAASIAPEQATPPPLPAGAAPSTVETALAAMPDKPAAKPALERVGVCPYLGLRHDARSYFLFATPKHRCFAGASSTKIEMSRQEAHCFGDIQGCPQYPALQRRARK
jgi:hypothetical protein